ncbi:hypothetical protein BKA80DRAFT_63968 [Phyllosticta citrichinensis]
MSLAKGLNGQGRPRKQLCSFISSACLRAPKGSISTCRPGLPQRHNSCADITRAPSAEFRLILANLHLPSVFVRLLDASASFKPPWIDGTFTSPVPAGAPVVKKRQGVALRPVGRWFCMCPPSSFWPLLERTTEPLTVKGDWCATLLQSAHRYHSCVEV